jgi:hypothetical protein
LIRYIEKGDLPAEEKRARQVAAMAGRAYIDPEGVLWHMDFQVPAKEAPSMKIGRQLVVPAGEWRNEIVAEYHTATMAAHRGAAKARKMICTRYWWPSLGKDISEYTKLCPECQEAAEPLVKFGLMQPTKPTRPNQQVWIDFAEMPESDSGHKYLLCLQDGFDKMPALVPTKDCTAATAAQEFVKQWVFKYGVAEQLGSDRGSAFIAEVMQSTCKLLGTKQAFSVAHHAASHGQVENLIKQVKKMLQKKVSSHQRDWDAHVPGVEAAIRFSPHSSTGVSPFYARTGSEPMMPVDAALLGKASGTTSNIAGDLLLIQETMKKGAEEIAARLTEARGRMTAALEVAQQKQKVHFDKDHKAPGDQLKVGTKVLCENHMAAPGTSPKLRRPWEGPWEVVEAPSNLNRIIRHCSNPDKKKRVHVSQLKVFQEKKIERPSVENSKEQKGEGEEEELEVEDIMQEKVEQGQRLFLVKWKGHTKQASTWEPEEHLQNAQELLQRFLARPAAARQAPVPKLRRSAKEMKNKKGTAGNGEEATKQTTTPPGKTTKEAPAPEERTVTKSPEEPGDQDAHGKPQPQLWSTGRTKKTPLRLQDLP